MVETEIKEPKDTVQGEGVELTKTIGECSGMVGGEQQVILRAGQVVLGMTTGRIPPGDKETWWWNDEVKDAIRVQKEVKKKWDASGRQEEIDIYKQANTEAKKVVARSKAHAMDDVYKELETPEGERNIHRIAKARDKSAKYFTQIG